MDTVQETIAQLIKIVISPIFKANNFKKSNNNWYHLIENLLQCVSIQSSTSNTRKEGKFTFNIGLFYPNGYTLIGKTQIPKYPSNIDCFFTRRIGFILPEKQDTWYSIEVGNNLDEISSRLKIDICSYLLPYLKTLNHEYFIQNITNSYKGPLGYEECAMICQLLIDKGEKGKALDFINYRINNAHNKSYSELIGLLKARIISL